MSDNQMLYCLIAFILGWIVSRYAGNGFSVGGNIWDYIKHWPGGTPGDPNKLPGHDLPKNPCKDGWGKPDGACVCNSICCKSGKVLMGTQNVNPCPTCIIGSGERGKQCTGVDGE